MIPITCLGPSLLCHLQEDGSIFWEPAAATVGSFSSASIHVADKRPDASRRKYQTVMPVTRNLQRERSNRDVGTAT
jgi:hypothetical protein